jgi:hypothetical protein
MMDGPVDSTLSHPVQDDTLSSDRGGDSTIDAVFLAELPDELRAEVIAQQTAQTASRWPELATNQSVGGAR